MYIITATMQAHLDPKGTEGKGVSDVFRAGSKEDGIGNFHSPLGTPPHEVRRRRHDTTSPTVGHSTTPGETRNTKVTRAPRTASAKMRTPWTTYKWERLIRVRRLYASARAREGWKKGSYLTG